MINKKVKFNLDLARFEIFEMKDKNGLSQDTVVELINQATVYAACMYIGIEPVACQVATAYDKVVGGDLLLNQDKKVIGIELNKQKNFGLYFFLGDMDNAIKYLELIFHEVRHAWQMVSGFAKDEEIRNYVNLKENRMVYENQRIEVDAVSYGKAMVEQFSHGKGAYKMIIKYLKMLAE